MDGLFFMMIINIVNATALIHETVVAIISNKYIQLLHDIYNGKIKHIGTPKNLLGG